jgi:sugar phosphate isomerase/epimerase
MTATPLLFPAVMTSSSDRDFEDLFNEVREISGVDRFDLMIARRADLRRLGILNGTGKNYERMAQIIADPDHFKTIHDWLISETDRYDIRVPALATYYPGITAAGDDDRRPAVSALVNAVRLAIDLTKRRRGTVLNERRMEHAIVEMVCGTVVDPAGDRPNGDRRVVYDQDHKLDLLCGSLTEVIKEVGEHEAFTLALELEPGEIYVLNGSGPNGVGAIDQLVGRLKGDIPIKVDGADAALLRKHVGLNLDIAHMRIAGIKAADLRPFSDRIVHAHISDHPGMHTHDQIVGSWTNPGRLDGGYREYLDLLLDRAQAAQCRDKKNAESLPFSGAVAVELEGCCRIFSIHDSLARLKHAIQVAAERRNS